MAVIVYDRARELARQELDRIGVGGRPGADSLTYLHALLALVEGLSKYGPHSATPVLLDEPRARIERDGDGHQIHGCLHMLPDLHFGEVPLEFLVSYHYFGWEVRRAARKWKKRARLVATRLQAELGGYR